MGSFRRIAPPLILTAIFLPPADLGGTLGTLQDRVVYGPETFERDSGQPDTFIRSFPVPSYVTGPFTLHVQNGRPDGTSRLAEGVSSARISLNGIEVVHPSDFNQNVPEVSRTVDLGSLNELTVMLNSGPDRFIVVTISGVINLGRLQMARSGHSANVLPDGTILLAGGRDSIETVGSAEQFDPETLSFSVLPSYLNTAREEHASAMLADGSLLFTSGERSGDQLPSAERMTPAPALFENLSDTLRISRSGHTATTLLDGRALIVGGRSGGPVATAEVFDAQSAVLFKPSYSPQAGAFIVLPGALSSPRWDHTATLLPDGRVLIAGGQNSSGYLSSVELFDPATESFSPLSALMSVPRSGHASVLMPDGRVLLLGGRNDAGPLATAELFDPTTQTFSLSTTFPSRLSAPRYNHTATLLSYGEILVAGGENSNGLLDSAEFFGPPAGDVTSPVVVQINPPNGAAGVDLTEIIGVRFSEPVDVRTLNLLTVTLTGEGPVETNIHASENGLMAFLVPNSPLAPGTTYTVSLSSKIQDTSGNPLHPFTSRFTTVSAPAILTLVPNHGPAGTAVTIEGQNFDPSAPTLNRVKFGVVEAAVVSATAARIETSVPSDAPIGEVEVTVTTRGGTAGAAFTVENPVPSLDAISPASVVAGSGAVTLILTGNNFIPSSSVNFGGVVLAPDFLTSHQLRAQIPADAAAAAGNVAVTIINPGPGGGESRALVFTLNNPVPTIISMAPTSMPAGIGDTLLMIYGTDFASGAVVQFNGMALNTQHHGASQLSATIPSGLLSTAGAFPVTVINPAPGGGGSNLLFLELRVPITITPGEITQGDEHKKISIKGPLIQPGATVEIAGEGIVLHGVEDDAAYHMVDSRSGGPAYAWMDATDGLLALGPCDDCSSEPMSIGFPFKVMGHPVSTFWINSNGLIAFGGPDDAFDNRPIPTPDEPGFFLAPFWDDLYEGPVYVKTVGEAPRRTLVVQWNHIGTCCNPSQSDLTFEVLLDETTQQITFQYRSLSGIDFNGRSATVGVEGPGGATGQAYLVDGLPEDHLLTDGLALTFIPETPGIVLDVSASISAPLGDRDVTILNPDGEQIEAGRLTVLPNTIQISIASPSKDSVVYQSLVTVEGTVSAENGVSDVMVNGLHANLSGDWFTAENVPLMLGANTVTATAFDREGHLRSDEISFEYHNPAPRLSSINPAFVPVNSNTTVVVITGVGFVQNSLATWGYESLGTIYDSPTQLTVYVPSWWLLYAQPLPIKVFNPAPGGGESDPVILEVRNPVPTVESVSPNAVPAGSTEILLSVRGHQFIRDSAISFDGDTLRTTFVSESLITASLSPSNLSRVGLHLVTVINPATGGGQSAALDFTVTSPLTILPDRINRGTEHAQVILSSPRIQKGASVQFSGNGIIVNSAVFSSGFGIRDNRASGGSNVTWYDAADGAPALPACSESDFIYGRDFGYGLVRFYFSPHGLPVRFLTVNCNGMLRFESGGSLGDNLLVPFPDPNRPNFYFAPFWDRLQNGAVYVKTFGEAPNRVTVVEWNRIHTQTSSPAELTFEVLIDESTQGVTFQYQSLSGADSDGRSAIVGAENPDGTVGYAYLYNGVPTDHRLQSGLAVSFLPVNTLTLDLSISADAAGGPRELILTQSDGTQIQVPDAVTVVNDALRISISSPNPGARTPWSDVMVQGTVETTADEAGVVVNGVLAQVHGNRFTAHHVPLPPGASMITASATDSLGNKTVAVVPVHSDGEANPLTLQALPESGVAPMEVKFSIIHELANPIVRFTFDADGDGNPDLDQPNVPDSWPFTYTQPGLYQATINVTDDQGSTRSATLDINVFSLEDLDTLLRGKWEAMKTTIINGDKEGALIYYLESSQGRYQGIFNALGDHLSEVFASMQPIQFIYMKNGLAKYRIRREEEAAPITYYIHFQLDDNGLWRIKQF